MSETKMGRQAPTNFGQTLISTSLLIEEKNLNRWVETSMRHAWSRDAELWELNGQKLQFIKIHISKCTNIVLIL